ncbi:hypothetical protein SDC9_105977 [bioreactor metagenome]|uniref:Uncharacterized protein n=1 Tax=bioreactor metagenome TaxID=1076179 RepID=A0A645B152_9ZZZZ
MQHAAQPPSPRGEHRHHVSVRLAVVDDDRFVCGDCHVQLVGKRFALCFPRGEVVVIVQSDFADGDYFFVLKRALYAQQIGVIRLARAVRVDAGAAVDGVIQQRERLHLGDVLGLDAGLHKAANARLGKRGDQRVTVWLKLVVEQMRVGIEQSHFMSS